MVGLIDLAPTLLELAGIQVPASFGGRSLVPLIRGNQDEIGSENYSCTIHTDSKIRLSLRTARRKLICDKGLSQLPCQLYDLGRDPREQQDLTRDRRYARDFVRLRAALQAWFAEQMEGGGRVRQGSLDLRAKELLRRAGYLEPEEERGS
jgi:arylsulfatase A-like enzyme